MRLGELKAQLANVADPARAIACKRYFKTGKGEYGEGDVFIGITMPQVRQVVRQFRDLPLSDISELLHSPVHEKRMCALLILVSSFERGDESLRRKIYRFYLANTKYINNWDLVDLSAPRIVGAYLLANHGSGDVLMRLAKSRDLWKRRIAIMSTFAFIQAGRHIPTFNIAALLLNDEHDLIHKAVGWMLREVGKRIDRETEEEFLKKHYKQMPRTMLRHAIERFPRRLQLAYLGGRI